MSQQQLAELKEELSQQMCNDERMLLKYEARFWKHRAWRAEQQRDRAELARKEAQDIVERYKAIPEETLQKLLSDIKNIELLQVKKHAESHIGTIGLINFRKLERVSEELDVSEKIKFWKNVGEKHRSYGPQDDDDSEAVDEE